MILRVVSGAMAALFVWAASVQLNDPDPARWMGMYLSAAVVAGLFAAGKPSPLSIVPSLVGVWSPAELGASMSSAHPEVELGRELGGLLIAGGYSLLAFFRGRRAS
jgi:hypothetical protein